MNYLTVFLTQINDKKRNDLNNYFNVLGTYIDKYKKEERPWQWKVNNY